MKKIKVFLVSQNGISPLILVWSVTGAVAIMAVGLIYINIQNTKTLPQPSAKYTKTNPPSASNSADNAVAADSDFDSGVKDTETKLGILDHDLQDATVGLNDKQGDLSE